MVQGQFQVGKLSPYPKKGRERQGRVRVVQLRPEVSKSPTNGHEKVPLLMDILGLRRIKAGNAVCLPPGP